MEDLGSQEAACPDRPRCQRRLWGAEKRPSPAQNMAWLDAPFSTEMIFSVAVALLQRMMTHLARVISKIM